MNTAQIIDFNSYYVAKQQKEKEQREKGSLKRTSKYKSNGQIKASAAEPIKRREDIAAMQEYFLEQGRDRDYVLLTLGIALGLRVSDLTRITLGDVYWADGKAKEEFYLYEQKTGKKNVLYVNSRCRKILEAYWNCLDDHREKTPLFAGSRRVKGELKAISGRQVSNILKEAAEYVGVREHISSHSLRKTFVYHSIKNCEGDWDALFTIQRMLNHRDFKTTLSYCGIEKEKAEEIRESLADIL